jgi:hypothetical protein
LHAAECRENQGSTWKGKSLESVPLGVTTLTSPVFALVGTIVMISEAETTWKAAVVPLKVTLVAPVKSVPIIFISSPALPTRGRVSIKGLRPIDRLKIVPSLLVPPEYVVPKNSPLVP